MEKEKMSDPDTFFSLFERVANSRGWPDSERVVMLQSVFTGKAQAAYSALGERESRVYKAVKEAVLKAYELVPEAYRQRFRSWSKSERQSHVEFARDLTKHFNRWCSALDVKSYEELCDVIVLEQFIDCVPPEVATHIIERGISTVSEAATVADEYILAHKGKSRKSYPIDFSTVRPANQSRFGRFESARPSRFSKSTNFDSLCNYCHERGHWKFDCPGLRNRGVHPTFVSDGFVSLSDTNCKVPVKILRDTGATDSFIRASVLPFSKDSDTGDCVIVRGVSLVPLSAPLHKVFLTSGFVEGNVHIAVRPALPLDGVDVILGNDLAGDRVWPSGGPVKVSTQKEPDDCERTFPEVFTACVLVRKWIPQGTDLLGTPIFQIVVPTKFREEVLSCSHNQTGHLGVNKTYHHILRYFFWPRLKRDIASFIKTCHTCQLTGKPNQSIKPAPLHPIPAIENPFEHLIIDCVGPLPKSKSGSQYLLTVMCLVTRYPAA
uniref:Gypsy retrotransposon integrase-like protein 1 n=1 Tax=Amphiprion ocellaris TaxID=80972 RepID=A0AAQ5X4U8_AMPOC